MSPNRTPQILAFIAAGPKEGVLMPEIARAVGARENKCISNALARLVKLGRVFTLTAPGRTRYFPSAERQVAAKPLVAILEAQHQATRSKWAIYQHERTRRLNAELDEDGFEARPDPAQIIASAIRTRTPLELAWCGA